MLRAWPGTNKTLLIKKQYLISSNQTYLKSASTEVACEVFRVVGYNKFDKNAFSDLIIGVHPSAYTGFDNYDAEKYVFPNTSDLKSLQLAIYMPTGEILAQDLTNATDCNFDVDVAYYVKSAAAYTIELKDIDPVYASSDCKVMLTDFVLNKVVSLKDSSYTFFSDITASPNKTRFKISVTKNAIATTINPSSPSTTVKSTISYSSDYIRVEYPDGSLQRINVFNTSGMLVKSFEAKSASAYLPFNLKGVYVVKAIGDKGVASAKIVASENN